MSKETRIIILSNRLPVRITEENDHFTVSESIGGLATGMKPVQKLYQTLWIGWAGIEEITDDPVKAARLDEAFATHHCQPVYIESSLIEAYYDGFSNSTIWPLFHYFVQHTRYDQDHWAAYREVNRQFAAALMKVYQPGDRIWIHDYHLLLLPAMIRELIPRAEIGFFLHIPFPSFEIFRLLPWRREIIEGLLGANLIGFHTFDYERHFLSSVRRLLGYDISLNRIETGSHQVKADVFPLGIDYQRYRQLSIELSNKPDHLKTPLQQEIQNTRQAWPDLKLILSIDRLDYTKGIPNRLEAFELFLERNPELRGQVSMLMIATPTRDQVDQYQQIKKNVDELVGRINGKFGQINWTPVWYFYRSFPPDELIELYRSCHIAMITPVRDGMNLVAKEYVASRTDLSGTLILSEMAGAARELSEAIQINPNDPDGTADAIRNALLMSGEEQTERIQLMQKRLERYTVDKWASDFLDALQKSVPHERSKRVRLMHKTMIRRIVKQLDHNHDTALFLDYDGTLVSFKKNPEHASPDAGLKQLLNRLSQHPHIRLVIISGRDKETLDRWFGNDPFYLIAEHGAWIKNPAEPWNQIEPINRDWKEVIRPTLEFYADRTPGSFVEEKNFSLAWHYRPSDPELGLMRAIELKDELTSLVGTYNLEILEGNKVIEIKNSGINKGRAANLFLSQFNSSQIIAMGDDWTDEYMFRMLPRRSITIKVGRTPTRARYFLHDQGAVRDFLHKIIRT